MNSTEQNSFTPGASKEGSFSCRISRVTHTGRFLFPTTTDRKDKPEGWNLVATRGNPEKTGVALSQGSVLLESVGRSGQLHATSGIGHCSMWKPQPVPTRESVQVGGAAVHLTQRCVRRHKTVRRAQRDCYIAKARLRSRICVPWRGTIAHKTPPNQSLIELILESRDVKLRANDR